MVADADRLASLPARSGESVPGDPPVWVGQIGWVFIEVRSMETLVIAAVASILLGGLYLIWPWNTCEHRWRPVQEYSTGKMVLVCCNCGKVDRRG